VDADFLEKLVIKKARNTGNFNISYIHAAFNKEACSGEIFIEFQEALRVCTLIAHMEDHGACQVSVLTFKCNDGNESASNALVRIWTSAAKTGCEYTNGKCSNKLLAKAQEKFTVELAFSENIVTNYACVSRHRVREEHQEFDIVKKKRIMQQPSMYEEDQSPEAFANFQAFVDAVWPALDAICQHDEQLLQEDLCWIEEQKTIPACMHSKRNGFVYAAWNPCFAGLVKIGATKRQTPYARLKELSGSNVPKPFELVACLQADDPFTLEKKIHTHFKDVRVQKGTRFCEFFQLSKETVSEYFAALSLE